MPRSRNADKSLIKSINEESRLTVGESVMLKYVAGVNPGDPTQGIGVSYTFKKTPTRAVIESVTQTDVLNSGGLYALGDIRVQLNESLREAIERSADIGDRMIWRNNEYRIVGKKQPNTLLGDVFGYSYTMRKVGD